MEIKLEKGKKVKLKELTVDERDALLDSCEFIYNDKGEYTGMKAVHSTMTKFVRVGVDGDTSDDFIKTLTFADKTNIFTEMQKFLLEGEKKPSK